MRNAVEWKISYRESPSIVRRRRRRNRVLLCVYVIWPEKIIDVVLSEYSACRIELCKFSDNLDIF